VLEDGGRRPGPGVVAHVEGGVESRPDAVHHAVRRRRTGDEGDTGGHGVGVEVAAVVVRVTHDDLVGPRGTAAFQRREQVVAHGTASAGVAPALRIGVPLMDHAADSLEVDRHEDLHMTLLSGRAPI